MCFKLRMSADDSRKELNFLIGVSNKSVHIFVKLARTLEAEAPGNYPVGYTSLAAASVAEVERLG